MPEYRHDPLNGRMVIVAEERAARPHQFDITDAAYRGICPFCEGNESLTPKETAAFRTADSLPNTPNWQVRVVPNKYPAVVPEVKLETTDGRQQTTADAGESQTHFCCHSLPALSGLLQSPGVGLHEVIIDTPRHVLSVSELTPTEVADMLAMYRLRLQMLRTGSRWAFVQIFKNVGAAAGASLPHSHSQLVAMPFLPPSLLNMLSQAEDYTRQHADCFWCRCLKHEIQTGERLVEETEHFAALCPFVSRFAGEIEIYPKTHESGFEQLDVSLLAELAELFRRTIIRLETAVSWMKSPLAYNIVLNTAPFRFDRDVFSCFHWHFSILPSLARAAGFEWGSGLHINPISPEQAARRFREALL